MIEPEYIKVITNTLNVDIEVIVPDSLLLRDIRSISLRPIIFMEISGDTIVASAPTCA